MRDVVPDVISTFVQSYYYFLTQDFVISAVGQPTKGSLSDKNLQTFYLT